MYLSCLLIDGGEHPDRPRPGRLWIRNHYRVHQRLCMAFPSASKISDDAYFLKPFNPYDFGKDQVHISREEGCGFLFRIDFRHVGRPIIIVQSGIEPNWEYAFKNADYLLAACPEVKPFNPCFTNGQTLRFRLIANPTRKIDTKSGQDGLRRHGRRVPVRNDKLYAWLACRAVTSGFSFNEDSIKIQPGYVYVNKAQDDKGLRLRSVRYDGILNVTDTNNFRNVLIRGIGAGKAFGFGLLSVLPITQSHNEI